MQPSLQIKTEENADHDEEKSLYGNWLEKLN